MKRYFEETIWYIIVSWGLIAVLIMLPGCKEDLQAAPVIPGGNCATVKSVVNTANQGKVFLPRMGLMVEESHYQTQQDYAIIPHWPKSSKQGIDEHLEMSCAHYKIFDPTVVCDRLYRQEWERVWTPSEKGNIGQGSRGNYRPLISQEMWQGTMMVAGENFPLNTRMLARFGPRAVVLYMGHEVGPGSKKYLGGMSVEAHAWLGTNNETQIELSLLKDQTLPFGPINCK